MNIAAQKESDIQNALENDDVAARIFHALPPSHKKEYIVWINSAKKPQTRAKRIIEFINRLKKTNTNE